MMIMINCYVLGQNSDEQNSMIIINDNNENKNVTKLMARFNRFHQFFLLNLNFKLLLIKKKLEKLAIFLYKYFSKLVEIDEWMKIAVWQFCQ